MRFQIENRNSDECQKGILITKKSKIKILQKGQNTFLTLKKKIFTKGEKALLMLKKIQSKNHKVLLDRKKNSYERS